MFSPHRRKAFAFLLIACAAGPLLLFQNCSIGSLPPANENAVGSTQPTLVTTENNSESPVLNSPNQPNPRCDTGWILIKGNADLGTQDFCIMKFEAQNSEQAALTVSTPAGVPAFSIDPYYVIPAQFTNGVPQSAFSASSAVKTPWVYVTQKQALAACQRVGAHLTTMAEAQTVSRDIFLQSENWESAQVGQGCMYGGHLDLDPTSVLAAPYSETATADHYSFTNDAATDVPQRDMGACFTRSRILNGTFTTRKNGRSSRRTMVLSNSQIIWDWSGNASEWIANTCSNNGLGTGATSVFANQSNGYGFFDYNPADHTNSSEPGRPAPLYTEWTQFYLADFEAWIFGPRNPKVPGSELMTSQNGVGMYQGCHVNGSGIYRGGAAYHGPEGGIFQTHMDHTTDFNHDYIGFRCVKAPNF